jgi:hypothetical protein
VKKIKHLERIILLQYSGGIFFMLGKRFCLQQYFPRDEEIVYRYTPFYKFEDLASSKELYLSRGDQFDQEDSYEGTETKFGKNLRRVIHDSDAFDENTRLYEQNRRCVAINSWYVGDRESEAMWNKFAKGTDGIAIRTQVGKIRSALSSWDRYLCVRKMEYTENHDGEFTKFGCPFFPFSIKRKRDYVDENELRIIYGEGKGCIDGSQLYKAQKIADIKVRIPIDPSILIGEIVLSPKSTIADLNKVQKISEQAGLHVPIVRSSLI